MHKSKAVLTLEISWSSSSGRDEVLAIGGGYFISFRYLFLLNPCSIISSYLFSSSIFLCTKEMCVWGGVGGHCNICLFPSSRSAKTCHSSRVKFQERERAEARKTF